MPLRGRKRAAPRFLEWKTPFRPSTFLSVFLSSELDLGPGNCHNRAQWSCRMAGNTVFDFVNQDGNDQDAICQHKRCKYLLYGLPGHYPGVGSRRGLMTPFYIPKLPGKALEDLKSMSYQHRAVTS